MSPTDNWLIHCSKSTSVYTQVDGRGHGLDCQNYLAVLWADLAVFRADMSESNNRQPCAMCHQQTTGTSTAANSHQCTRRCMVEAMDWTAQIIRLFSGPIWQFFVQTCQKVTTDNHALCATNRQLAHLLQKNQTSVHAGGWQRPCIGLPKLFGCLLGQFGSFSGRHVRKNNRQPCPMCHQQNTGKSTAAVSHQCTRRWVEEAMDWTAQIIWLSSGPIWQFSVRTCQKETTDNHALCATYR